MPELSNNQAVHLLNYTLQLADNALILGHRLSEWCGHGPVLEQDIAITNISLDHLGQARSLYQYASEQFNNLPADIQQSLFATPMVQQVNGPVDEDDFAFLRDALDFKNVLLVEQPNGDWAYTIARSFFIDTFNYFLLSRLQQTADATLAAVAEKSLKEVAYHMRWSSEWVVRLGDGTEESHRRMQKALDDLWDYTGELFIPSESEQAVAASGQGVAGNTIQDEWRGRIGAVVEEATLRLPESSWTQEGGKKGLHSEYLGFILAEMQFMQRAYPGMEW
jgi:ring-1,2-phenylacetyl-CoA epoxidase subunit PaaC